MREKNWQIWRISMRQTLTKSSTFYINSDGKGENKKYIMHTVDKNIAYIDKRIGENATILR